MHTIWCQHTSVDPDSAFQQNPQVITIHTKFEKYRTTQQMLEARFFSGEINRLMVLSLPMLMCEVMVDRARAWGLVQQMVRR